MNKKLTIKKKTVFKMKNKSFSEIGDGQTSGPINRNNDPRPDIFGNLKHYLEHHTTSIDSFHRCLLFAIQS